MGKIANENGRIVKGRLAPFFRVVHMSRLCERDYFIKFSVLHAKVMRWSGEARHTFQEGFDATAFPWLTALRKVEADWSLRDRLQTGLDSVAYRF